MHEDRDDQVGRGEGESPEEASIDLNMLFSEDKRDLNRLFPDARFRRFLRDLKRNQRDVNRFLKRVERNGSVPEESGGAHEVS